MKTHHSTLLSTALVSTLWSCAPAEETPKAATPKAETTFSFETFSEVPSNLQVTVDGIPRQFALVQIVSALRPLGVGEIIEDITDGELFFQGATDAEGRCSAPLNIPTSVGLIDVIVNAPGTAGPYSVPEFRALWGPFAPSSRVTVDRAGLADLELALWSK